MPRKPEPPSSITENGKVHPLRPGKILPQWQAAARAKGFEIVARVGDRQSIAVKCDTCGGLTKVRTNVVLNHQPLCKPCQTVRWRATAAQAGLEFVTRDPGNRHYGLYLAPCGHRQRRQFSLVDRVAAGTTGIRCETCHAAFEAAEASARGWTLLGPDPDGQATHRLYSHGCGITQRIALINMRTGRFGCHNCGTGWAAAPSSLYLLRIELLDGTSVLKLGFSRDPESRHQYQLRRNKATSCELLRTVTVATGHQANLLEKGLHKRLRIAHPEAVLPASRFRDTLRVKSEIYTPEVELLIHRLLDEVAAAVTDP